MRKIIDFLFFVYSVLLIFFFWKTAYFWYNMRYMNEDDGDKLSGILLLAIEVLSIFLFLSSPKHKGKDMWIHWVCFLWEVIMIFVLFYNHAPIGHYIRCLAWPLFFETAYIFVRSNIRLVARFRKLFYVFVFIGGLVFFSAMELKMYENQSNMIYFMLLPVPVLMLWKNVKWQYSILVFTSFFALMSMKRSMMLAVALCWGTIVFRYLVNKGRKTTAIFMIVLLAGAAGGFFMVIDKYTGGGLSARTTDYEKEDITNGREGIYLVTIDMIARSSSDHLLFGHGHNGVKSDSFLNISAHNEFLEIIYDYGIIMHFSLFC